MNDQLVIGKLLKIHMNLNNIGVRDLAKEIGVSAATVSRLTGGKDCDLKTYFKISNWLWRHGNKDHKP